MNHAWLQQLDAFYEDVDDLFPVNPWPHQHRAIPNLVKEFKHNSVVTMFMHTGSGKSNVNTALTNLVDRYDGRVIIYTPRKMLTWQTALGFDRAGINYGARAASLEKQVAFEKPIQVASMQTTISRCLNGHIPLHEAELVIVDEAHLMAQGDSLKVLQHHLSHGSKILLVTASPLGLSHLSKRLYVGSQIQELRDCGAHVKVICKGLREMDVSMVRRVNMTDALGNKTERYSLSSLRKNSWHQAIVSNVLDEYGIHNPDKRMAMGVAPGVPESRQMAETFARKGLRAAHIDAKEVYVDGEYKVDVDGKRRKDIMDRWSGGEIDVVWTCQVLREGIDLPNLYHLMLAAPILSLKDMVQVVGRICRKSDKTPDHALLTDHGGNLNRHVPYSPNRDYDWLAAYEMDDKSIRHASEKHKNDNPDDVPAVCPNCGTFVRMGRKCPPAPIGCGEPVNETNPRKLRLVVQESGALVPFEDDFKQPRKPSTASAEQKQWDALYWASRKSKSDRASNFNQLKAAYRRKYRKDPPDNLFNMPLSSSDWKRKVRDVSMTSLRVSKK